jgi:tRNA pseudouridine55 synthase
MTNFQPGFILIDKEIGISSAKALYPIKKSVPKGFKVGHAGTLDPFASGLLIVAVGKATKALQYAMGMNKTYEFTVRWGEATDTDDITGKIIQRSEKIPALHEIPEVISKMHGVIKQKPPKYSAIHVNGKRAYDLARDGIEFELQEREVKVIKLSLVSHDGAYTSFILECGKGCYVRSIATDIAAKLGTCCYVSELRRTKIGSFTVNDSSTNIIPILEFLSDFKIISVDADTARKIMHGQTVSDLSQINYSEFILENKAIPLVAICRRIDGEIKINIIS